MQIRRHLLYFLAERRSDHPPKNEPIAGQSLGDHGLSRSGQPIFPKSVPNCSFPKWPVGDGETGKIALNEWPVSGIRIVSTYGRLWAIFARPLFRPIAADRLSADQITLDASEWLEVVVRRPAAFRVARPISVVAVAIIRLVELRSIGATPIRGADCPPPKREPRCDPEGQVC